MNVDEIVEQQQVHEELLLHQLERLPFLSATGIKAVHERDYEKLRMIAVVLSSRINKIITNIDKLK